jgi:hypothetical protein
VCGRGYTNPQAAAGRRNCDADVVADARGELPAVSSTASGYCGPSPFLKPARQAREVILCKYPPATRALPRLRRTGAKSPDERIPRNAECACRFGY